MRNGADETDAMGNNVRNQAGEPNGRVQVAHQPVEGFLEHISEVLTRAEVQVIVRDNTLAEVPGLLHELPVGEDVMRVFLKLLEEVLDQLHAIFEVTRVIQTNVKIFLNVFFEETADKAHAIVIDREFGDAQKVDPRMVFIELATEDGGVPDSFLCITEGSEAVVNVVSHSLRKLLNRVADRTPAFNLLLKQVEPMVIHELCSICNLAAELSCKATQSLDLNRCNFAQSFGLDLGDLA